MEPEPNTSEESEYKYFKLKGPIAIERTEDGTLKVFALAKNSTPKEISFLPGQTVRFMAKTSFVQLEEAKPTEKPRPTEGVAPTIPKLIILDSLLGPEIPDSSPQLAAFKIVMTPIIPPVGK